MTIFLRAIRAPTDEKADVLRKATKSPDEQFDIDPSAFQKIPGSPFCYWVSDEIRATFSRHGSFNGDDRTACITNPAGDDKRFYRTWWEVNSPNVSTLSSWRPLAKGGAHSRYYYDVHLLVAWDEKRRTYRGFTGTEHRPLEKPASVDFFFRPGLTWPRRTTSGFGIRVLPRGCIFGDKSPGAFNKGDKSEELLSALAICVSSTFRYLIDLQMAAADAAARSYEVGVIQGTPFPALEPPIASELAAYARTGWFQKRLLDLDTETSHVFTLPKMLMDRGLQNKIGNASAELIDIESKIDLIAYELYSLGESDRTTIGSWAASKQSSADEDDEEPAELTVPEEGGQSGVQSWAVGVAFARFDIRLATGERAIPPEPDPFDPLPAKSPGMLPDGDQPFMPTSGVFVDDPGHADDLAARVTAVYERVGEAPPAPQELRRTLAKDFFPAHIRMYSKSRRKAPIYWQLATPSASYSVWLYIHAFGKDTQFRVQNDYVAPKLAHERRQLEGLRDEAGPSPTTAQSRAIETQAAFVEELSALLDEVKRVAPLWDPNLDDGVILNFAPLWRLVPQNRAWQKELRDAWGKLIAGDYDWAHLSMRLWPERVVPKCAKDRSLAIAHGLEDVFWFEDEAGKWKARPAPTRPIEALIAERTSPAVKAALASLVEAPDVIGPSRRGRKAS